MYAACRKVEKTHLIRDTAYRSKTYSFEKPLKNEFKIRCHMFTLSHIDISSIPKYPLFRDVLGWGRGEIPRPCQVRTGRVLEPCEPPKHANTSPPCPRLNIYYTYIHIVFLSNNDPFYHNFSNSFN